MKNKEFLFDGHMPSSWDLPPELNFRTKSSWLTPGGIRSISGREYQSNIKGSTTAIEKISDCWIYGEKPLSEKFYFPDIVKKIRIDIGLSTSAPNSCDWLLNDSGIGVIGIEANPICNNKLFYGGCSNPTVNCLFLMRHKICKFIGYVSEIHLKENMFGLDLGQKWARDLDFSTSPGANIKIDNDIYHFSSHMVFNPEINFRLFAVFKEVVSIDGRFNLLEGAIDDVEDIIVQDFYSSWPALGCSSLVKGMIEANERPAGNISDNINVVNKVFRVPSFPLDMVLEHIDWNRFPFIECIKIDVEGKDLDALKSCKKHMDKVVHFRAEAYDDENIVYGIKKRNVVEYMLANNFELIDEEDGDYGFINKKFKTLAKEQGLSYR